MYKTFAIAKKSKNSSFEKIEIGRKPCNEADELDIDVKYCGFCHTDSCTVNAEWGNTFYPAVAGHEVAGVVTKVGANIKDVQVGDHVGIGYVIDACLNCHHCQTEDEINCLNAITATACGAIKHGRIGTDNDQYTHGGWSQKITAHRRFVFVIPKSYPLEKAGPVFCGGITMFRPLYEHGAVEGGLKVGIVGLGGLGQNGILIAKAMGNHVTIISSSDRKKALANQLGADDYLVSKDEEAMKKAVKTLDLIIDTIPVNHDINPALNLLKKRGTYVVVGVALEPFKISAFKLIMDQVRITGSATGGMNITQKCIDFFAEKNIRVETELIKTFDQLHLAEEKLNKGNDTGLRYVIDIEEILA